MYSTASASSGGTSWASRTEVSSHSSWRWTTRRGSPRSCWSAPARSRRSCRRRPARALPGDHGLLRQRSTGRLDLPARRSWTMRAAARVLNPARGSSSPLRLRVHGVGASRSLLSAPGIGAHGLLSAMFSKLDCTPRWRERLPEITAPTLVVHGAADPFFPVGNAKALAEEIPGATLLVLDGVGAELPSRAHAEVATACSRTRRSSPVGADTARRADPGRIPTRSAPRHR